MGADICNVGTREHSGKSVRSFPRLLVKGVNLSAVTQFFLVKAEIEFEEVKDAHIKFTFPDKTCIAFPRLLNVCSFVCSTIELNRFHNHRSSSTHTCIRKLMERIIQPQANLEIVK